MHFHKITWDVIHLDVLRLGFDPDNMEETECYLRDGVEQGYMEAWLCDGTSYAITELRDDCIFVHAYVGRDMRAFATHLYRCAQMCGVSEIQFCDPRHYTLKLLQDWEPERVNEFIYAVSIHPLYDMRVH